MGWLGDIFRPDLSGYFLDGFLLLATGAAFVGGIYLMTKGRVVLGVILAGGAAVYAFMTWG